jgi:cytochrome c-type biogenesis protein CcmH
MATAATLCATSVVRTNNQHIPLMVSLSNHEQQRSSFDRPVLSETLILRQAQDERRVERVRTSGVVNRETHHTSDEAEIALDRRVAAFSRQMRCLVCQNETLADSQAELAVDLRREIREQMKAGRSDDEVTQFLTERYGDFVRYRPPLAPKTYLLWFGPFVLLAGVLVTLYRGATRWSAPAGRRPLSPSERKRAQRLLTGHGGASS